MKKTISILLAAIMILPFGVLASLGVSAAETVLYVSDSGSGDGSAPEKAMADFKEAVGKISAAGTEGKIVICGDVTLDFAASSWTDAPAHKTITICGKDENAKLLPITHASNTSTNRGWYLMGDVVFENLHIEVKTASAFIINSQFHNITFGEGMTMENTSGISGARTVSFSVAQKSTLTNEAIKAKFYDAETNTFKANPTFTMKSGTFSEIVCFQDNSSQDLGDLDGTFTVNVSGNVKFNKLVVCRNAYSTANNAVFNFDGGSFVDWVAACDRPASNLDSKHSGVTEGGTFTINLGANFDILSSPPAGTSTTAFYGFQGPSCSLSAAKPAYLDRADYIINIDETIYDKTIAFVNADAFDKINKVETPAVEPEKPNDPQPPVVEPEKPDEPSDNPDTGDMTVVFAAFAVMAVSLGAAVVLKKRA